MTLKTRVEVAAEFRCSPRKISDVALRHGIGFNLGGNAGWRFDDADVKALADAMRPAKKTVAPRRRRRSS